MRGVPAILNFNAGEFTPLFDARSDQDKYGAGCKTLQNFLCTVQGPAIRRAGTRYVANTKNNGLVWLSRFVFNRSQSYILEFGDNYIRFYTNRGQLQNAGAPYEVATPWTYAQLTTLEGTFALQFAQSNDVLYITHASGTFAPQKLSRLGATNWTLTALGFNNGPFQDVSFTNTITVTPSALTGNVTLTASAAIFDPTQVGTTFYFEGQNLGQYAAWEPGKAITVGQKVRYNGNVYNAQNANTSGTVPPTHLFGTAADGTGGTTFVVWQYLHSGYGYVTITGYTSATVVTGTVSTSFGLVSLPGNAASPELTLASNRWALQDVGGLKSWPVAIDFYKERLVLAAKRTVYLSSSGNYEDWSAKTGFQPLATNAVRLPIALKTMDAIRWLSANKDLLIGTDSFEFTIQSQTEQQVFGPGNVTTKPQTNFGSRTQQPIEWESATLYVQAAGRRLREAIYSYQIDRYQSEDLSILAEHIPTAGITDICMQRETDPVVWSCMADGSLAGTTYNRVKAVLGWHRHVLGGFRDAAQTLPPKVLSLEAISAPNDKRDDVWFAVERNINGATARFIEYLEDYQLLQTGQANAFYVDAGVTYSGAPAQTITGLNWLEGQTVQICANGGAHGNKVVTGGSVTLDFAATTASIGLGYVSTLKPMRIEFGANDGTSQSRMKSVSEIVIRLKDTLGGRFGVKEAQLDFIPYLQPALPIGAAMPLFTGDKFLHAPADWNRDGFVVIQQDQPLPMTVLGIYPRMTVND